MRRKVLVLLFMVCFIFHGCTINETAEQKKLEVTKGNCNVFECIDKISSKNTVQEINEIIGFEGELTDEKYNKYYWELSESAGIEVTYYSSSNGTIKVDIENDLLKDKHVDFSKYDLLKEKINEGITYDEFISYIGNTDGYVIEKSSLSTKYIWVDDNGNYLKATFSNSTNKCTIATGMIK